MRKKVTQLGDRYLEIYTEEDVFEAASHDKKDIEHGHKFIDVLRPHNKKLSLTGKRVHVLSSTHSAF